MATRSIDLPVQQRYIQAPFEGRQGGTNGLICINNSTS